MHVNAVYVVLAGEPNAKFALFVLGTMCLWMQYVMVYKLVCVDKPVWLVLFLLTVCMCVCEFGAVSCCP